jgi:predicted nucleic acid-binding Zn ribbon protein
VASEHSSTRNSGPRKRKAKQVATVNRETPGSKRTRSPVKPATPAKATSAKAALRGTPHARRRALAQWRGIDMSPIEQAASLRVRPLGQLVPHVLKSLGLDQRRAHAEILRVWQQLIDPTITAHAHPTGLRRGTLFVAVDSNVWLSEIVRYRYDEILDRLQHSFGKDLITRISFRAE